ncbi:hypothetical protein Leryth_009822 [Lithospermum erythrorhizon]|nr:hypothetical protein Leryth_009822 [Lithospermum erythrorhizon]
MEMDNSTGEEERRLPLSEVVAECVKRWFELTLLEAEDGDLNMQVLVAQMYHNGYGVPKDAYKGRAWIERASKSRLSALLVEYKHPGYSRSDSDSDYGNGKGK